MREIKFRAWDTTCNVMYKETDMWKLYLNGGVSLHDSWTEKDEVVLMQYTGLKSKSGVEIYEGDILQYNNRLGKVVWHEYLASFDLNLIKCIEGLPFIDMKKGISNNDWRFKTEVIGNIYQNPELCK